MQVQKEEAWPRLIVKEMEWGLELVIVVKMFVAECFRSHIPPECPLASMM